MKTALATRLGGIVAGLLVLAGCTTLAPDDKRPQASLPAQYAETSVSDARTDAAELAWRDYFTDPELRMLITQALAGNRDLRQAMLRVDEARAAYGITQAERLPTVGVALESQRGRTPADFSPTGRALTSGQQQLGVGFNSWELDLWGRVRNLSQAALQDYLATDEARRARELLLVHEVADAWLGLRALDQRIQLAERTLQTRAEARRVFGRRVEVGAASQLEYTQVELLWQQARALLTELQLERDQQQHVLALLLGQADFDLSPGRGTLSSLPPMRELAPGLPSQLLENRPDIIAAERQLMAANARIGAARAAFFPRIALTTMAGTASSALDDLFSAGSRSWTFAPSISLPIFDGGRRRAALDLAELRQEQAVVAYEQAIEQAFRDVANALSARARLDEQLITLRATEATQTRRAALVNRRFDAGAARYFEVLDAERDLLSTQQQVVQTEQLALSARLALYAALGGGSQALAPAFIEAPTSAADAESDADQHMGHSIFSTQGKQE